MLRRIIFLFLCLALLTPVNSAAQKDLTFSAIEVDLWPEYDRTSMLVIYRITLAPSVSLPASLAVRIPSRSGVPNAVAARQPDSSLINIPYNLESSTDWNNLVFQAPTSEIQVEYYDPALIKDGSKRSFEYIWAGDYSVDQFTIQIQQPIGAREMTIVPSFGEGKAAPDGFVYYISDVGSVASGQTFLVNLEYRKDTDDLSLTDMPVIPSGPISDKSLASSNIVGFLPYGLALIGIALLVGGGWWYYQSGRDPMTTKSIRRRNRRKPASQDAAPTGEDSAVYCHQCGKRASTGDRFCRTCGTQLRIN